MMKTVCVRNIPRAPQETIAALGEAGVATVHEGMGRSNLMASYMRPVYEGAAIAGSAVTCLCAPGDNWMIHVAAEQCKAGDILVIACMVENTDGMIGDLIATSLKARGVKGVVIDAGARDVKTLKEMGFPIWSRAISARGTVKATVGNVNLPVVCAGVSVNPGDVIVADDDGVVVVPRLEAARAAELAQQRLDKEAKSRGRYEKGELTIDVANMRPALQAAGLVYVDSIDDL